MEAWLEREFIEPGRLPLFLCFLAFTLTFLITRSITRLIRSGKGPFKDNVSDSGIHVHHAVPGILILIVGAFLAVGAAGNAGWAEFAGVLVGIGTSLVLDEFALILRLDDVYWAKEGQLSVQMVAITIALLGLVLIGVNPFAIDLDADTAVIVGTSIGIGIHLVFVLITIMKGKFGLTPFAFLLPPAGLIGAIRLARPESRWAERHYGDKKQRRAVDRAAKFQSRYAPVFNSVSNFIAGAPTEHQRQQQSS